MSYIDNKISRRKFLKKVGFGGLVLLLGGAIKIYGQRSETKEPENVLPKIKALNNEFKKAEENYQSRYSGVNETPEPIYNERGGLEREEFSRDGEVYKVNKYVNGNLETETLYLNGEFHMISEFSIYSRNLKGRKYFIEGKFFRIDTFKGGKLAVDAYDINRDGKFDPNIEPSVYRKGSRKSTKK